MSTVAEASQRRVERLMEEEIDKRIDLLLAGTHGENPNDRYHAVTANPRTMGYLRFLLRYYAKFPHPWTKCFTADTPVDCELDETPISQLKPGDLVWSFNSELHLFELKPVVWGALIRKDAQLAMLTLDDGAQIKATPDHKFMRRDGSWAELQDLVEGDSLMPRYPGIPVERFDKEVALANHKVASVEALDEREDVWDIEVADNHSFVVSGVVAHNCVADNFKRFGPKAKGLCAVVKDTVRQTAMWRHGAPRGTHPGHPDAGSPGVAIGEADKWAAPAWGGHHHMSEERPLSLLDELDMEFGAVDHTVPLGEAATILCSIGEKCDVYRVLIGLDDPPALNLSEVLA